MDMGKIPARAQVKLLLNPNGAADSTPASGTKSAPPWVNGLTNYPSPDAAEQPFGKTPLRSNIKPGRSASNAAMLERAGICSLLRPVFHAQTGKPTKVANVQRGQGQTMRPGCSRNEQVKVRR